MGRRRGLLIGGKEEPACGIYMYGFKEAILYDIIMRVGGIEGRGQETERVRGGEGKGWRGQG